MTKRAHGEGNIRQRADGRWEARIPVPQPDGGVKRESIYGKTQAEVRRKLTEIRRTIDQGGTIVTERQTVAAFLDRWLAEVVKPSVRPKTYHSYAQLVQLHLSPGLGRHQLAKLTPQHVQAFMNAKL
jgi:integrase